MYELIKIENTPSVSARELHEFLESKQEFSTWIKKRIENKDYILIPQIYQTKNSRGGDRRSLHYAITLDMENTDRGFEVREYFIACEKQLQTYLPISETLPRSSRSSITTSTVITRIS